MELISPIISPIFSDMLLIFPIAPSSVFICSPVVRIVWAAARAAEAALSETPALCPSSRTRLSIIWLKSLTACSCSLVPLCMASAVASVSLETPSRLEQTCLIFSIRCRLSAISSSCLAMSALFSSMPSRMDSTIRFTLLPSMENSGVSCWSMTISKSPSDIFFTDSVIVWMPLMILRSSIRLMI